MTSEHKQWKPSNLKLDLATKNQNLNPDKPVVLLIGPTCSGKYVPCACWDCTQRYHTSGSCIATGVSIGISGQGSVLPASPPPPEQKQPGHNGPSLSHMQTGFYCHEL